MSIVIKSKALNRSINNIINETKNNDAFPNPFDYRLNSSEEEIYKVFKTVVFSEKYKEASQFLTIIKDILKEQTIQRFLDSALIESCKMSNLMICTFLILKGAQISYSNYLPFVTACIYGHLDLVNHFKQELNVPVIKIPHALIAAAINGQKEIVYELTKADININYNDTEVLRICSANGMSDMVYFLLKLGANVHALDDRSLIAAIEANSYETVKILLDHGANPNTWDGYCFEISKRKNFIEIFDLLDKTLQNNI